MYPYDEELPGGPAAQTGSLTHVGIAEFHRHPDANLNERIKKGWDAIAKSSHKFPLADENEVKLFYTPYCNDPRNIKATIANTRTNELAIEQEIRFTLPPHPLDPTGELIYFLGHYDHIRVIGNTNVIFDLKTGKKTGWEMVHDYAIQLALYCYGLKQVNFPDIQPIARIIRSYSYRQRVQEQLFDDYPKSPDNVYWSSTFNSWAQIDTLLEIVRLNIALMRLGEINFHPGPHCTFCELGGHVQCQQKWEQLYNNESDPLLLELNKGRVS